MNILHRTHFNNEPLLFAAWTGAGNVGILAMDYLRRKLDCHLFAQIDMSQFITPDSIVVNSGVAHFPDTPQSVFYHNHNPDLIIFESNAHAGGVYDVEVMGKYWNYPELKTPDLYCRSASSRLVIWISPEFYMPAIIPGSKGRWRAGDWKRCLME